MKKILFALTLFSFLMLSSSVFSYEEDTESYDSDDMFSEYINSNEDESKDIELTEDKYEFDYRDYVTVKYTSRTLKDVSSSGKRKH